MSQEQLDKTYDPRAVEPAVYALWEKSGAFGSEVTDPPTPHEKTFTIVMPPPNVTGALHLGHALNNTLQDILIRYHRMRGFKTLWQPGTDHAGIATQAVVERRLRETEGLTRHQLGREELVRRIWQWKDEYEKRIVSQLKLMGCSCDWERSRFTLDEGMSKAVRHMFFQLFKDGLIFRGKRLVNWDTQLQTAVSDDEVYHETVKGHFWHFKYPVIPGQSHEATKPRSHEGPGDKGTEDDATKTGATSRHEEPEFVVIATTRPETMLGDTAVAVHPDPEGFFRDEEARLRGEQAMASSKERAELDAKLEALAARRESHLPLLIQLRDMARDGRKLRLPLVEREIPLIADEWANPTLGTGCVKITPAHDPNDYEVGLRHHLPMINVLTADGKVARIMEPDGKVNPFSSHYEGLSFSTEGRRKVVEEMQSRALIDHVEDRDIELGHSDRSKLPIEPFLSDQWFLTTRATKPRSHEATEENEDAEMPKRRNPDPTEGRRDGAKKGGGQSSTLPNGNSLLELGLAQTAMEAVTDGRIQVFPSRYAKTYLDWLSEERDWCISRQLWWGHRIPIWSRKVSLTDWKRIFENDARGSYLVGMEDGGICARLTTEAGQSFTIAGASGSYEALVDARDELGTDASFTWLVSSPREIDFHGRASTLEAWLSENGFAQDPDVLDTWFSSALWPFSTLGWPEKTPHLSQHYPGRVLCTSRDIITNWVARMVMFGLYALGEIPFDHVYVHPKILDGRGETMSKSKGNGVDPVDIIHTHGADALRYSMADLTTETQDIRMPVEYICPHCTKLIDQPMALKNEEQNRKSRGEKLDRKLQPSDCIRVKCTHKECGKEFATQWASADLKQQLRLGRETSEKFEIGRNFCNKLWNAARFAFMNLEGSESTALVIADLPPEDRWILARLSRTIRAYHQYLATYQFSASVKELRDFFWDCLCDWYLELTKPRLSSADAGERGTAQQVLAFCLDQALRLWHPTMPFITERLWRQLNDIAPRRGLPGLVDLRTDTLLIAADFPPLQGYPALEDDGILTTFEELQNAVRGVRELRSQCSVPPKQKVHVTVVVPAAHRAGFSDHAHIVQHMAGISELGVVAEGRRPLNAGSVTLKGLRIYVHDVSDDAAERVRTAKELEAAEKQIVGKESKLANANFVAHADSEVVSAERKRLSELLAQRDVLRGHLEELGS